MDTVPYNRGAFGHAGQAPRAGTVIRNLRGFVEKRESQRVLEAEVRAAGATAVFSKPFDDGALLELVRQAMAAGQVLPNAPNP